jgi:hypothetical protein
MYMSLRTFFSKLKVETLVIIKIKFLNNTSPALMFLASLAYLRSGGYCTRESVTSDLVRPS